MAAYMLKPGQEAIQVVDGAFAGRRYSPGIVYHEIPPQEAHRFAEVVREQTSAPGRGKAADKESDQ